MAEEPGNALHSRYNPSREAERFVDSLQVPSATRFIVVCEPGESYLAPSFRNRCPQARLIAVRLTDTLFLDSDGAWDCVWRPRANAGLVSFLIDQIPDEYLGLTRFVEWPPAAQKWSEEFERVRNAVSSFLDIQKRVMLTRTAFGPRWLKNAFDNLMAPASFATVIPGSSSIFLSGAGPSLNRHIDIAREAPFLVAVSSALWSLRSQGVKPDLCVATDGGFWARRYFTHMVPDCALCIPQEAAVPVTVLERCTVVPLHYGSALESELYGVLELGSLPARRNGTVSGTAAELALSLTSGTVFASGLDFRSSAAYHHCRPHFSESDSRARSSWLSPEATAFFPRGDGALDIYARWFESSANRFRARFNRLIPSGRDLKGMSDSPPARALERFRSGGTPPRIVAGADAQAMPKGERIGRIRDYLVSLSGRFEDLMTHTAGDISRRDPALLDFMQLADYRGFLEIAPLWGAGCATSGDSDKMGAYCANMGVVVRGLRDRVERYGR